MGEPEHSRGEAPERLPRLVVLRGSPAQIGLAHGRLLAPEIDHLVRRMDHHIFKRVGALRGLPLRLVARSLAAILERHIPNPLRMEIRGIAAGSGVPYRDLLLVNCLDDILNILRRLAPRAPSLGCSSFAVLGERTRSGSVLHGRNLDYHFRGTPLDDGGAVSRLLLRHTTLFAYHPDGGNGFVSLAWPGVAGVTTAMNEAGLSVGNLTSYVRGTTPSGVPLTLLYRTVMEQASSLREVGKILRSSRRTIGNNLMASSGAENDATLFEITMDSVEEVPPESGIVVATNHFVTGALASRQRPYLLPHSVARRSRLGELCDRTSITLEEARAFLADTGCDGTGGGHNPFARVANQGTAVSVLFSPVERDLWIGTGAEPPASSGRFVRAGLDELLERD